MAVEAGTSIPGAAATRLRPRQGGWNIWALPMEVTALLSHPTNSLQPPCLAPSSKHCPALLEKGQCDGLYGWIGQSYLSFWLKV